MTSDIRHMEPKRSPIRKLFRKFVDLGAHDEFNREWDKFESLRRATRKKLFLKRRVITHTEASITVKNADGPRPEVTFWARVSQAEAYSSYYEPDAVLKGLRKCLPAERNLADLEEPIGDLADSMSSAEIRLLMERDAARRARKELHQAERISKKLEKRSSAQETETQLERTRRVTAEQALVRKTRSTGALAGSSTSKRPSQIYDQDHHSQLKYYQQLGVVTEKQSSRVLENQRRNLEKVRAKERMSISKPRPQRPRWEETWSRTRSTDLITQHYSNRDLDLSKISEGGNIALVPKDIIQGMRNDMSQAKTVSRTVERPTVLPARTNAFFRNRDRSPLVAKVSSVSLEMILTGEAAKGVRGAVTDMIGSVTPMPRSIIFSSSSTTISEETMTIDPDDPVPKSTEQILHQYEALDSDQHFRLLAVEPFVESGRFLYKMKTFSISDAPPFESVSYVWGEDERKFKLSFGDSSILKITPSLFAALPILSEHCRTGWLWIDQICIDQKNLIERNHQVKSMGNIYRRAEKVFVFLGPVAPVIHMDSLFTLVNHVQRSLSVASTPATLLQLQQSLAQVIKPHYSDPSDEARCWRDLVRLFQHPWFTRAWIFQELVLSNIVLFSIDRRLAPLDSILHLALAAANLEGQNLSDFRHNECLTRSPGLRQLQQMVEVRSERMKYGSIHPQMFWKMFSQVAPACQSSDERDKLYAFLGLLEDPRIDIQPDYRNSVAEVFSHAASAVVTGQQSLDLLAFVDRLSSKRISNAGLPSWVPDWRQTQSVKLFNQKAFSAAKGRKYIATTYMENSQTLNHGLIVEGMVVDKVTYVAASSFHSTIPWKSRDICSFLNLDEHVERLMRNFGRSLGKPTQVLERLLCTILAEGAGDSTLSHGTGYAGLHPAKVKRLLETYHRYGRYVALHRNPYRSHHGESTLPEPSPSFLRQLRQSSDIAFGRRIFATRNLRLGLGPENVAIGDYICILHGSSLPIVLRKVTCVKGQCFVEGIMRGEAVTWKLDNAKEYRIL